MPKLFVPTLAAGGSLGLPINLQQYSMKEISHTEIYLHISTMII